MGSPILYRHFVVVLLMWSPGGLAMAQSPEAPSEALVNSLQSVVVRALNHRQGDIASMTDAKEDFTASGWSAFMKQMQGWLDENGAPTFTSRFTPSGPPLDISSVQGVVRLTVPGVLEHEYRNANGGVSTTSYRAEVDVEASRNPTKIEHLKQRTCGGASTIASCR